MVSLRVTMDRLCERGKGLAIWDAVAAAYRATRPGLTAPEVPDPVAAGPFGIDREESVWR